MYNNITLISYYVRINIILYAKQKHLGCKKGQGQEEKGGQVTKPIMVVKIPCELLCVIKVKGFFHKQSAKLLGLS